MGSLRPWHVIVVVAVLVLLFGAKRLPLAARSLGRSMRILKAEAQGLRDDAAQDARPGIDAGRPEPIRVHAYTEHEAS